MVASKKEAVALSSVLASALMAVLKLVVGLMTGSLGILSEAAHSFLDLGAALLTWFAVRIGDQPADERHPYGHGKVENVSALIETGLLFVTALWIAKEAVARMLDPTPAVVEITWYGVAVIVVSIFIDINRSRALARVAKETGSQALEADALHFSSDILSSLVVLVGLGFVALGWPQGDAIAAFGVAGFVLLAAWRLGKRTIDVLIDTAPEGVAESITALVALVPGIARVERVRVRPGGAVLFAEVVVKVRRNLSFEQVAALRTQIEDVLRRHFPSLDPMIISEPLTLNDETVAETVHVLAANEMVSVSNLSLYRFKERRHVGFDLEVDDHLTIHEAHEIASALEERIAAALGGEIGIDIHIDPRPSHTVESQALEPEDAAKVEEAVMAVAGGYGVHQLSLQREARGLYIAFDCTFPDNAPVTEVHEVTARMERILRQQLSPVARVVIHAEPRRHTDRVKGP